MSKKESVQKRLQKVRPPRVQMTYEVDIGDATENKELPFVMGVVGDFGGQSEIEQKRLKEWFQSVYLDGLVGGVPEPRRGQLELRRDEQPPRLAALLEPEGLVEADGPGDVGDAGYRAQRSSGTLQVALVYAKPDGSAAGSSRSSTRRRRKHLPRSKRGCAPTRHCRATTASARSRSNSRARVHGLLVDRHGDLRDRRRQLVRSGSALD